jgi:hypothetical protein
VGVGLSVRVALGVGGDGTPMLLMAVLAPQ